MASPATSTASSRSSCPALYYGAAKSKAPEENRAFVTSFLATLTVLGLRCPASCQGPRRIRRGDGVGGRRPHRTPGRRSGPPPALLGPLQARPAARVPRRLLTPRRGPDPRERSRRSRAPVQIRPAPAVRPPTAVEGRGWAARLPDEVASGAPPPAPSHGRRGRRHGARGWVPWAFPVATARRCQRPFARTAEAIYALSPRVLAPLFTAAGSRNS